MNRKELIKRQTWIYFWQQKAVEMVKAVLIILAFIFIPFFVGKLVFFYNSFTPVDKLEIYYAGFATIIAFTILIYVIYLMGNVISYIFLEWIKSNWNKAKRRAKEKYQNKRRKK